MKNIFKISVEALSILVGLSGCGDFFEMKPGPQLDLEDTFTDRDKTERYLRNIYSHIPDDATGDRRYSGTSDRYGGIWGLGSMEAHLSFEWGDNGQYANSWNIGASSAADSQIGFWWGHFYKGIAKASTFIQNVDMCTDITEDVRKMYKAEARALRAMYYFYIFRQYGPCVLLGDTPMPIDADVSSLLLPRSTVDDCVDYIVGELDAAAEVFGTDMVNYGVINGTSARFGRVDKGQCKALKAKILLYAASPLYNGNAMMSSVKNDDGTQLIPSTVDPAKWERARDAYKEFLDEFVPTYYDLHVVKVGDKVDHYESYRQATQSTYVDAGMKELIMSKLVWHGDLNYAVTPKHSGINYIPKGGLGFAVTQQFVDMFFTKEGYRIEDPESGYREYGFGVVPDETYYGSAVDFNDPLPLNPTRNYFKANTDKVLKQWMDREPRFYVNVTYNGSTWLNQTTQAGAVTTELTFNGNSGKRTQPQDSPLSGYGWRKTARTGAEPRQDAHVSIQLRLADMYLGYAEALNEAGNSALAIEYINKVRARAGVAEYGTGTYTDVNGTERTRIVYPDNKDAVRQRIQRERLVELALEASHFFDVRRWMVAGMAQGDGWVYPSWHNGGEGGPVYGMNAFEDAPEFFEKVVLVNRVFQNHMYFMPIPNAEVLRNPQMVQNYEWSKTME